MSSNVLPRTADVELVSAFTMDGGGGNLAGVVLAAEALAGDERQRVATAVGASETAFVRAAGDGVFEVEFYTPNQQVPDCGHATVATFALLAQRGALHGGTAIKRTIIGDRAITVEGERVFMEQPRPALTPFPHAVEVAAALGISPDAVREPVLADHGVRFVLVETTLDALVAVVPDQRAIEALTAPPDAIGLYVYARPDEGPFDATIRMFAPRYGIPEESATGMAAGLLGGYLARDAASTAFRFVQGALSPQPAPSKLIVRVRPDRVLVGGTATVLRTLPIAL